MNQKPLTCIVVGGGAAGFFAAIICAQTYPQHTVILLEKTRQPLAKVRISGGGRCNVTHACFDPALLVKNYPRGNKELVGPFHRFQSKDTIAWFESKGISLKTEEDGRMFPVTDSSDTIIQCLYQEAKKAQVDLRLESGLKDVKKENEGFTLTLMNQQQLNCDRLLVATGSAHAVYPMLEQFGHTLVPLVPSLFTFNVPRSPLEELAGISVSEARVKIAEIGLEQKGPVLITHWGFSGPAVLKLSAWGARPLHALDYKATLFIDWIPSISYDQVKEHIEQLKVQQGARQLGSESYFGLPKQLWRKLIEMASIELETRWASLNKKHIQSLIQQLKQSTFAIQGKTTYKQEFVTCGGVALKEVNFKTMESRLCPGLFFAGEVLDIDGITGGFNFQNAWTTGWIAGQAMGT